MKNELLKIHKDYRDCKPKVVGGFGNKCNKGTQYHQHSRIYYTDVCVTVTTCCMPYFVVVEIDGKSKSNREIES